jgi:hypothetical protein
MVSIKSGLEARWNDVKGEEKSARTRRENDWESFCVFEDCYFLFWCFLALSML